MKWRQKGPSQIALKEFRDLHDRLVPKGSAAGFQMDEDGFEAISMMI